MSLVNNTVFTGPNRKAMRAFVPVLFTLILITFASFLLLTRNPIAATSCPPNLTDKQCYDYLQEEARKIESQKKDINKKISTTKKEEGNLASEVAAIENEIRSTEIEIKDKQIKIELRSLEIENIKKEIGSVKERIDSFKNEIARTKEQVKDSIIFTYNVSNIPPWYYIAKDDLFSTFEMVEYVNYIIRSEKSKLGYLSSIQNKVQEEEKVLLKGQEEIITKRNEVEKESLDLEKLKSSLKIKKEKQVVLLAELVNARKAYESQKRALKKIEAQVDSELTKLLIKMSNTGQLKNGSRVVKGQIIGFQGHTGCAFGSHLHYAVYKNGNSVSPFDYLSKNGSYVLSGSKQAPLKGALITQWYHEGYAIDMISTLEGSHDGSQYCKNKYSIKCPSYIYSLSWFKALPTNACFNQNGEGAPVYAFDNGTLYRGTDSYGSNYVLIDHGDDLKTIYYHLK